MCSPSVSAPPRARPARPPARSAPARHLGRAVRQPGVDSAALLVAELAANAVTHGRVPGRDFELTVKLLGRTLRVEVSDARGERRPPDPGASRPVPRPLAEKGRGLLQVEALADRWDVLDRAPVGKTVFAELDLTH